MVKGEIGMAHYEGYGKPNMAALPNDELGRAIMRQIRNTPPPDRAALQEKADAIEAKVLAARKEHGSD